MSIARPTVSIFRSCLTRVLIKVFKSKLPPGANRMLFVKNLNYTITGEDLYDLFGRYGSIRQIRIGNEPKTKGTAFVVFDDVMDVRTPRLVCPTRCSAYYGYAGEERSRPS
jgi:pre-mRNA branch site protein p14